MDGVTHKSSILRIDGSSWSALHFPQLLNNLHVCGSSDA